jgi:hypothetical protein
MAGRIKSMKNSNAPSGIESACGAVFQTTAPPRAPMQTFVVFSNNVAKDLF